MTDLAGSARLPVGRLDDRVVLVTGAARGLGIGCAESCLRAGARVFLIDRDGTSLAQAEQALRHAGQNLASAVADVTAEAELREAVDAARRCFGEIDGAIVNAGVPGEGSAEDVDPEDWDRVLSINLKGAWLTARAALPSMRRQRRGSLVFQGSVTALVGRPSVAAYSASKGGVVALARQIPRDEAVHGIRANSICPGTVATPMALDAYAARSHRPERTERGPFPAR